MSLCSKKLSICPSPKQKSFTGVKGIRGHRVARDSVFACLQHYSPLNKSRALKVILQQETYHLNISHTAIHMGQGHQRSSCNKNLCTFLFPFLQPFKWVKGIRDHCATRDSTLACHHHYKHSHWSKQLEVNCNERLCTIPSLSLHPLKQVKGIRGHCAAMYKHQHCIHSSWLRVLESIVQQENRLFPIISTVRRRAKACSR